MVKNASSIDENYIFSRLSIGQIKNKLVIIFLLCSVKERHGELLVSSNNLDTSVTVHLDAYWSC